MMNIPCVLDKCLVYPACRSRQLIECETLNTFLAYLQETRTTESAIDVIRPYFPYISIVHSGNINPEIMANLRRYYLERRPKSKPFRVK